VLQTTGGKLDFLCNNAGFGQVGAVEDLSRDAIRKQFETNVFGAIELTNEVIPVMRRQGSGRIINISSILGMVTLPYRGAYNASKFALEGFTDTLRQELYGTGIYVILIEPGAITSQFRAAAFTAYQQNINAAKSSHRESYQKLEKYYGQAAESPLTTGQSPELVLQKLIDALESPQPKIRYYVTASTYILVALKRILPQRTMDWILRKIAEGKK
jgi:short-subunit dehydrogenase